MGKEFHLKSTQYGPTIMMVALCIFTMSGCLPIATTPIPIGTSRPASHFATLTPTQVAKVVIRPRRLPPRAIPTLAQVQREAGAARVLNVDGSMNTIAILTESDVAWHHLANGTIVKRTFARPHPVGTPTGPPSAFGASFTTIERADASDLGKPQDFTTLLFGSGSDNVRASECQQFSIADCWLDAFLCGVSVQQPQLRATLIEKIPDRPGYYKSHFRDWMGNRIDVVSGPILGNVGCQPSPLTGATWIPRVEKALPRVLINSGQDDNRLHALDYGFLSEAAGMLGWDSTGLQTGQADIYTLLLAALARGDIVCFATNGQTDDVLIAAHAYTLYHIFKTADGIVWLTLINPWGLDGTGNDGNNDGFVTITLDQLRRYCGPALVTTNRPKVVPIAGDGNGDGVVDLADFDLWQTHVGFNASGKGPEFGNYFPDNFVDLLDFDTWFKAVGSGARW